MATFDTVHKGTYTGTGAEQVIEGIRWKPFLIFILDWTSFSFNIKSAGMPGKYFGNICPAGSKQSGGVTRTDEGFTVHTNEFVNAVGHQYFYVVMRGR